MKKIFLSSIIIALGLTLSNCGSDTGSLIDKQAKITKLRNKLTHKSGANLDTANKLVEDALAKKEELSKKLNACSSKDIKKLSDHYDCQIVELDNYVVGNTALDEAMLNVKCKKPTLEQMCESAINEIKGMMHK